MFRKIVFMLFSAGMVLLSGIPVRATDSSGSVCVIPDWAGSRVMGGQVTLYRIGEVADEMCRITDGLADWIMDRKEIMTDDFLQWSLGRSWGKGETRCIVDETGALFSDLDTGIYLVVQKEPASGFSAFEPFLVILPDNGSMHITINPMVTAVTGIPRTGDYPAPIFMAMFLSFSVVILMILSENRKK